MPISHRKPRREHILPKRYQDPLPEPHPAILPSIEDPSFPPTSSKPSIGIRIRRIFQTPWNLFGLSRRYLSEEPPNHDPDNIKILTDLVDEDDDIALDEPSTKLDNFYPYPNKSSFLLGDWYWCGGVQKSQESFRNLIGIVGDSEFDPADVRDTNWDKINQHTGKSEFDRLEWEDEDAGWLKSPVTISVPFPRTSQRISDPLPEPQNYTIEQFYHRSFTSVIREKLNNPVHNQSFHYEPYELLWRRSPSQTPNRVHGELYTSGEFLRVHNDLQESPMESGCNLPRVVIALMFWSDSTHLTSFGNAKLWPLYLGFGNESKYQRCKPSLSLLNHVAYFEKVMLLKLFSI